MDITMNQLPVPTWNSLHMNESKLSVPFAQTNAAITTSIPNGIVYYEDESRTMTQIETGMGKDIDQIIGKQKRVIHLEVPSDYKATQPILLNLQAHDEHTYYEIEVHAKERSEVTIVMTYDSSLKKEEQELLYHGVRTKFHAKEQAVIRFFQVQLLGESFLHLNDIGGLCEEQSHVELLQLSLGAKKSYQGCFVQLQGAESTMQTEIGYALTGQQSLDMNYVTNHYGKKTKSCLKANGVLQEKASKLFRGTIDFKHGSSGSEGEEHEDVLLLGNEIINQTIPLILCAEEDVQGNHGATLGQIDDSVLFYLCSRGMTKEEAELMLIQARIDALCSKIPSEKVQDNIRCYQKEAMMNGFTK